MTNRRTPVKLTIGIDRMEGETEGFFPKTAPPDGNPSLHVPAGHFHLAMDFVDNHLFDFR